jgi:hypothetical protein
MVKVTSALAGSNKSRATRRLLSASNCFNGTAITGPHHTGCKTPRLDTVRPIDAQAGLVDVAPFVLAVAVGMFGAEWMTYTVLLRQYPIWSGWVGQTRLPAFAKSLRSSVAMPFTAIELVGLFVAAAICGAAQV